MANVSEQPIRIVVADDQALVRGGLVALLGLEPDINVVAEASNASELEHAAARYQPDVCVVDIEMPGDEDGIGATGRIRQHHRDVRVLIVTTFGRPGYLQRALDNGASGFVVKDTPAHELATAIRRVHAGNTVVDPILKLELAERGVNTLTPREQEILRHALTGAQVADIASALHLSPGTVRNHLSAAITATGATTRVQAARYAQDCGWL